MSKRHHDYAVCIAYGLRKAVEDWSLVYVQRTTARPVSILLPNTAEIRSSILPVS